MLTQEIEYWKPAARIHKGSKKPLYVGGSEEHKEYLFRRGLEAIKGEKRYAIGQEYYVHGHGHGQILDIADDLIMVEWDGLKAQFIECWIPETGKSVMCHPSDLRRRK